MFKENSTDILRQNGENNVVSSKNSCRFPKLANPVVVVESKPVDRIFPPRPVPDLERTPRAAGPPAIPPHFSFGELYRPCRLCGSGDPSGWARWPTVAVRQTKGVAAPGCSLPLVNAIQESGMWPRVAAKQQITDFVNCVH